MVQKEHLPDWPANQENMVLRPQKLAKRPQITVLLRKRLHFSGIFRKKLRLFAYFLANPIDKTHTDNYSKSIKHPEVIEMRISYKKLWIMLVEKEIPQATLRKDLNIATGTMTKLRRNEEVALSVLLRICEYLDCNIGDICDAVRTDLDASV